MLNRRQVRIRAMQSLYAYNKAKGANKLLAIDYIKEQFLPDLDSMIPQDKNKLEGMAKLATTIFEEKIADAQSSEDDDYPAEVTNAINGALSLYKGHNKTDLQNTRLKLIKDSEKVYDLYINLLKVFAEWVRHENTILNKKTVSGLSKNKILIDLIDNQVFQNQSMRRPELWEEESLIRKTYKEILLENERFLGYANKVNHTLEEELSILKYLTKNVLLKKEEFVKLWEDHNIYFSEDKETLRSMVVHSFQPYTTGGNVEVQEFDEEWDEKKEFMLTLFNDSFSKEEELLSLILPKLKNWEFDRVAETDKILLKIALIEMMEFPSIPIKVTINEIIEISKSHSTPRSSQFINGILDVLSKELMKKGVIKKSGRGMLDNK